MDDVKDKFKGFMKKVNNQLSSSSSSSSSKFKGQGRVLGSSSYGPANPSIGLPYQNVDSKQNNKPSVAPPNPKPRSQSPQSSSNPESKEKCRNDPQKIPVSDHRSTDGFDPFGSFITSGKRVGNGYSLDMFECPVCGRSYRSEEEVSEHVESCISASANNSITMNEFPDHESKAEGRDELVSRVSAFVSGSPSAGSIEVVLKLLSNIVREPDNAKFRRIRMSNPKIREAVGAVAGGVDLLECVGFRLQEEGDEMWAVIEVPSEEQMLLIKETISLLEPRKTEDLPSGASTELDHPVEPKKVDRQIRVFFSVPESIAAKIDIPDSFYNLSAEELKREAELRKKKIAESQLLIPKSYKDKQEKTARKRYKKTVIRIQFPDGVVLQSVFFPWESTTVLYEFVSTALKEQSLEFELLHRAVVKWRVIPRFPSTGQRAATLAEEGMVPSALIKFKPIETDSTVFTGLRNELFEISEPLTKDTITAPA